MYGGDTVIRISRLQNGYSVGLNDPAIVKANRARDKEKGSVCTPWRDPQVTYAFKDATEVSKFVADNIDKVLPEDEYSSTFDQAAKEACTDD